MKTAFLTLMILIISSCEDNSYINLPEYIVFEETTATDLVTAEISNEFDTKIRLDTLSTTEKQEQRYSWDRFDDKKNRVVSGIYFVTIFSEEKGRIIGNGMVAFK